MLKKERPYASSAGMDLEEQFALMKEFYDKGLFIVRLHTGTPRIYGAIQEQMAFFDRYKMSCHSSPRSRRLRSIGSQFTIPESTKHNPHRGKAVPDARKEQFTNWRNRKVQCAFI